MPQHRENGINLFKQRCVQKCHSHGEACQPALKVWWVRASSWVCSCSIKHSVCPVWFWKLLFLNGLFCQHLLIPLRSEQRTFLSLLCWDFPGENRCEIIETERIYNHYRPNPTQSPSISSKAPFFRWSLPWSSSSFCPNTLNIYTGQDHQQLHAFTPQHITLHQHKI